ncbi:MAG TPA: tryptophan--tRNA ligase [Mycobacteriales bacterium]|jgi:tryptophanyl-tRNA synthetase|nr:tryptophan--tRNA ligase [Mycobacteriales bacterium]
MDIVLTDQISAPVLPEDRPGDQLERSIAASPDRFRILTGDRPTGALHLGHYFGTLANRVRLQDVGVETFVIIADYQVIADRDTAGDIRGNVYEILADQLAAGIDPERTTVFVHSAVPALNQLMLPFLSLVSVPELQRNPTVKAEAQAAGQRTLGGLMLTYPVHQAADILFCHGNLVPVGRDQLAHLEVARLIARRFNNRYSPGERFFPEPEALVGSAPVLLGTDGAKMSKSRGNAIELRASADETARLIRRAKTDSERAVTYEPHRRLEVANLLLLAALCQGRSPETIAEEIGGAGSGRLKTVVTESINEYFAPLRRRRTELAADRSHLRSVLAAGNTRANAIAETTLDRVREVMGMTY